MYDQDDFLPLLAASIYTLFLKKERRWYVRPINLTRNSHGESHLVEEMRLFDEETHFNYFRMSRRKFDRLLHLIGPEITRGNNHTLPIDPVKRLAMTLRFLVTGSSYTSIAHSYRTSKSTVSSIVYEVSNAPWKILQPLYLASPSEADWKNIAEQFHDLLNFPNCIGAIDGKHIALKVNTVYISNKQLFVAQKAHGSHPLPRSLLSSCSTTWLRFL